MKFTKEIIKDLRDEINDVLDVVADNNNITFSLGSIRYSENSFKVTLSCTSATNEDGETLDITAANYLEFQETSFEKVKKLGETFSFRNDTFEIVGYKPRSRKYPIIGNDVKTGKKYKFLESVVYI